MAIVHIASEVAPWSQTGGLADVTGALPKALTQLPHAPQIAVFSPFYRNVPDKIAAHGLALTTEIPNVDVRLGDSRHSVRIVRIDGPGAVQTFFVDCPVFFDRDGIYAPPGNDDYADNDLRYALFCRACIDVVPRLLGDKPHVIHAHDWQAALSLLYAKKQPNSNSVAGVFTIHNLAYQGLFAADPARLGLDPALMGLEGLEFYGRTSLLKGGIVFADRVTTVSPRYAQEILTPEFGCGFDGLLSAHKHKLTGIVNGIDVDTWNPATDPHLTHHYDVNDRANKLQCKQALIREVGLSANLDDFVVAVVSRLDAQKGLDLIAELAPSFAPMGVKLVVLGCGDPLLAERFGHMSDHFEHIAMRNEFDIGLARRIYASADAILIPSRFEPCGLSQLYAMRYGTVPIVNRVGGLRDTVIDSGMASEQQPQTGFSMADFSTNSLQDTVARAHQAYQDRHRWQQIVRAGMLRDSSWAPSALEYLALYRELSETPR